LCANPNVPLSLPEYFVHLFKPLIVGCSHTPNINETLCTQCKNNNIIVETATSSITAKRKKIMKKSQSLKNAYINDMSAVRTFGLAHKRLRIFLCPSQIIAAEHKLSSPPPCTANLQG
ncbi:unnamed protein product, partial [Rotaria sp. Silwood1]